MMSSYDIKRKMEKDLGKDFIDSMKHKKQLYDEYQKQLEQAKSYEDKISDKQKYLRQKFISINAPGIYPDEVCDNILYQYAKRCVDDNLTNKQQEDLHEEYEMRVIDLIQGEINDLQKELKRCKDLWSRK